MTTYHQQAIEDLMCQVRSAYRHATDKQLPQVERDAWDATIAVIDEAMGYLESQMPDYEERLSELVEYSPTPLGYWAIEQYKQELTALDQ